MSDRHIITIKPDKRGGKPCIRGMRITVYDAATTLVRLEMLEAQKSNSSVNILEVQDI